MNYLNGTEKLLKHWLKNKITITTSTVIGFLITGSLAFGALELPKKDPFPLDGPNTYTNTEEITNENKVMENGQEKVELTTTAVKIGKGTEKIGTFTFINEGGSLIAKKNNNNINGILVEPGVKEVIIENKNGKAKEGIIRVEDSGNTGALSNGIDSNAENTTIRNSGKIEVIHTDGIANGIGVANTFDINNSGEINVTGKVVTTGISVGNVTGESLIKNSGNIIVKGEKISGIRLDNAHINGNLKIINEKTGKIEIENLSGSRENNTAISITPNLSSPKGLIEFTNDGEIKVQNGIGIKTQYYNAVVENKGTIMVDSNSMAIQNYGGTVKTSGIVKITDKTKDELGQFDVNSLFDGNVTITGMIVDSQGNNIENDKTSQYIGGPLNSNEINLAGEKLIDGKPIKSVTIGKYDSVTNSNKITNETPDPIQLDSLNIINKVIVADSTPTNTVPIKIDKTIINLDSKGHFYVGDNKLKSELSISNGNVNKIKDSKGDDTAIKLVYGSVLNLDTVNFKGGIRQLAGNGIVNISGDTMINGKIGVSNINVGADKQLSKDSLRLASTSSFTEKTGTTITNKGDGVTVFDIGADGSNALKNSTGIVTVKGKIDFDTSSLTKDTTVELNNKAQNITHNLSEVNYLDKKDGLYTTALNRPDNTLRFEYNQNYFTDSKLNEINKNAQIINGKFSQIKDERARQMDKIYSGTIYSETIRGAYDNLKMNEKNILSLNNNVKANEFKAEGRALFEKNDYKREGIIQKYDATNKTSGVLASLEYGLTDTARTGLVLSGSKQDVKLDSGNGKGDIFYVGVYGNQSIGNYDFTTGLGYQLGKYDANNTILDTLGTSKYDTKSVSGYAQVKYIGDLGRGVSIQPKLKMGYTHLKQDNIKDSYFGLRDADVKTFDAEIGADLVKTVRLAQSNLDLKLGTSYIKTYGDTDKMFRGQFFGDNTSSNQFEVSGIELSENVLRFNLGAEVKNDNGFFYNGGFTYQFGSENKTSYGASLGIGYTF